MPETRNSHYPLLISKIEEILNNGRQKAYYEIKLVNYPKLQTLSAKLPWSHYCLLLSIEDSVRSFYEEESVNEVV